ncbi:barstar family protein [Streptomyces sp. SGAir0957]
MSTEDHPQSAVKHWRECTDVHDLLEQIRLRPGMWLPNRSLQDLQSMLDGYHYALGIHGVDEPFAFGPGGSFKSWLEDHLGFASSLGWAAEIERATPQGTTPLDEFFRLLDAFTSSTTNAPDAAGRDSLGVDFMLNSFVTLFWRRRLLDASVERLRLRGFRTIQMSADQWATEKDMHRAFAEALSFPDYYGRNLDAFNDCLGDVACYGGYDDAPEGAGLVLALTDYDHFAAACPQTAHVVLDIVADQARRASVLRRRLICLVHSKDPDIAFEPVGAMPVLWNSDEWADSNRG